MDHREQIVHFEAELGKLVDRFRMEYEIPYSSAIGVLQLQIHKLIVEAIEEEND